MSNLDPIGDFDPQNRVFSSLSAAQADPDWVERDILNYDLGTTPPYSFTVLYNDGAVLTIPLTAMWFAALPGNTGSVLLFRRHTTTGRIVPFQTTQSDPRLRDPKLSSLPAAQGFARAVPARFDTRLTPTLMTMLNEAQMIYLATGFLRVFELQLMNPLTFGWSAAAAPTAATRSALGRVALRRAVPAVARDAAAVGERLVAEVSGLGGGGFQQFIEFARRLSAVTGVSPQAKADLLMSMASRFGLEVGGQTIVTGGRILVVAKDARSAFQIALDGTIKFGRFNTATLDVAGATAIRPLVTR